MKESIIFSERNLTEIVHYVYRVTIDGYYYIGKHTGFLDDLITGRYKTSSKLIKEKLRNGHHFTKIKILKVFPTSEEALEYEKKILTRVNASKNPKFLNQRNGGDGDITFKQHTEKSKENLSKKAIARFDINTEEGRKRREVQSEKLKEANNINTEQGRKLRENKSQLTKAQFDPNTEEGRRNIENHRNLSLKQFDINTEQGRKLREILYKKGKERFNPETEEGRQNLEKRSQLSKAQFDPNTERGRKNLENLKEKAKVARQKSAEIQIQNRQNDSILGELMFDEEFIKENFLIIDDKNNLRFLWSVYSKLTGYKENSIKAYKQKGKLSFLQGIKSIKLSEEQELTKIKEIEAIIKSRNEENGF